MSGPPSRAWRRRARQALFGDTALPARVVLTPFAVALDCVPGVDGGGWWRVRHGRDLAVVHVPQASASADAVLALGTGHAVTFVGLCGSVATGPPLAPGTLVEPVRAVAFDGTTGHRAWPKPPSAHPVTVRTARNLAEASTCHARLAAPETCVDLETAWVLAAAGALGVPARAVLAVSDANRDGAVFGTGADQVAAWLEMAVRWVLGSW